MDPPSLKLRRAGRNVYDCLALPTGSQVAGRRGGSGERRADRSVYATQERPVPPRRDEPYEMKAEERQENSGKAEKQIPLPQSGIGMTTFWGWVRPRFKTSVPIQNIGPDIKHRDAKSADAQNADAKGADDGLKKRRRSRSLPTLPTGRRAAGGPRRCAPRNDKVCWVASVPI